MDTKLRTSFVPKKTLLSRGAGPSTSIPMNPILSLGVIIFFMTTALAGGIYLYKALLDKQILTAKAELVKAREAFEEKTILEWKRRDNRINVANELLNKHKVVSPIFSLLEETTLRTTRFLDFDFSSEGSLALKMKGEGLDYSSVALLSDSINERKEILNPLFSELTLSPKGGVLFSFSGNLAPSVISYKETFNQPEPAQ